MARINCGHCRESHGSVAEVRACSTSAGRSLRSMLNSPPPKPPGQQLMTPLAMLKNTPEGRYAVRPDSNTPYTFLRISHPKRGNYKGCVKVQTQHAERYELALVVTATDVVQIYNSKIDSSLLLLVVDPTTAAISYGRELERCSRCGIELTDERSRWYSIGPECVKYWPHIVTTINETKGICPAGSY